MYYFIFVIRLMKPVSLAQLENLYLTLTASQWFTGSACEGIFPVDFQSNVTETDWPNCSDSVSELSVDVRVSELINNLRDACSLFSGRQIVPFRSPINANTFTAQTTRCRIFLNHTKWFSSSQLWRLFLDEILLYVLISKPMLLCLQERSAFWY